MGINNDYSINKFYDKLTFSDKKEDLTESEKRMLKSLGIDSDEELQAYKDGMTKILAESHEERSLLLEEIDELIQQMLEKAGNGNEQKVADALLAALNSSKDYPEFVANLRTQAASISSITPPDAPPVNNDEIINSVVSDFTSGKMSPSDAYSALDNINGVSGLRRGSNDNYKTTWIQFEYNGQKYEIYCETDIATNPAKVVDTISGEEAGRIAFEASTNHPGIEFNDLFKVVATVDRQPTVYALADNLPEGVTSHTIAALKTWAGIEETQLSDAEQALQNFLDGYEGSDEISLNSLDEIETLLTNAGIKSEKSTNETEDSVTTTITFKFNDVEYTIVNTIQKVGGTNGSNDVDGGGNAGDDNYENDITKYTKNDVARVYGEIGDDVYKFFDSVGMEYVMDFDAIKEFFGEEVAATITDPESLVEAYKVNKQSSIDEIHKDTENETKTKLNNLVEQFATGNITQEDMKTELLDLGVEYSSILVTNMGGNAHKATIRFTYDHVLYYAECDLDAMRDGLGGETVETITADELEELISKGKINHPELDVEKMFKRVATIDSKDVLFAIRTNYLPEGVTPTLEGVKAFLNTKNEKPITAQDWVDKFNKNLDPQVLVDAKNAGCDVVVNQDGDSYYAYVDNIGCATMSKLSDEQKKILADAGLIEIQNPETPPISTESDFTKALKDAGIDDAELIAQLEALDLRHGADERLVETITLAKELGLTTDEEIIADLTRIVNSDAIKNATNVSDKNLEFRKRFDKLNDKYLDKAADKINEAMGEDNFYNFTGTHLDVLGIPLYTQNCGLEIYAMIKDSGALDKMKELNNPRASWNIIEDTVKVIREDNELDPDDMEKEFKNLLSKSLDYVKANPDIDLNDDIVKKIYNGEITVEIPQDSKQNVTYAKNVVALVFGKIGDDVYKFFDSVGMEYVMDFDAIKKFFGEEVAATITDPESLVKAYTVQELQNRLDKWINDRGGNEFNSVDELKESLIATFGENYEDFIELISVSAGFFEVSAKDNIDIHKTVKLKTETTNPTNPPKDDSADANNIQNLLNAGYKLDLSATEYDNENDTIRLKFVNNEGNVVTLKFTGEHKVDAENAIKRTEAETLVNGYKSRLPEITEEEFNAAFSDIIEAYANGTIADEGSLQKQVGVKFYELERLSIQREEQKMLDNWINQHRGNTFNSLEDLKASLQKNFGDDYADKFEIDDVYGDGNNAYYIVKSKTNPNACVNVIIKQAAGSTTQTPPTTDTQTPPTYDEELQDFLDNQLEGKVFDSMQDFEVFCNEYFVDLKLEQYDEDDEAIYYNVSNVLNPESAPAVVIVKKTVTPPDEQNELERLIANSKTLFDALTSFLGKCSANATVKAEEVDGKIKITITDGETVTTATVDDTEENRNIINEVITNQNPETPPTKPENKTVYINEAGQFLYGEECRNYIKYVLIQEFGDIVDFDKLYGSTLSNVMGNDIVYGIAYTTDDLIDKFIAKFKKYYNEISKSRSTDNNEEDETPSVLDLDKNAAGKYLGDDAKELKRSLKNQYGTILGGKFDQIYGTAITRTLDTLFVNGGTCSIADIEAKFKEIFVQVMKEV